MPHTAVFLTSILVIVSRCTSTHLISTRTSSRCFIEPLNWTLFFRSCSCSFITLLAQSHPFSHARFSGGGGEARKRERERGKVREKKIPNHSLSISPPLFRKHTYTHSQERERETDRERKREKERRGGNIPNLGCRIWTEPVFQPLAEIAALWV